MTWRKPRLIVPVARIAVWGMDERVAVALIERLYAAEKGIFVILSCGRDVGL
jgi:hypothetical protein